MIHTEEIYSGYEWHSDHLQPTIHTSRMECCLQSIGLFVQKRQFQMSEWMKPASAADCHLGIQYFKWYMIKCVAPTLSIDEVKMPMQTICHNCDTYLIYDMHHQPTNIECVNIAMLCMHRHTDNYDISLSSSLSLYLSFSVAASVSW